MTKPGPSNSDDGCCPGCGTTTGVQPQPAPPAVQTWTCTACGLHWATTVVNPTLRVTLSIVALLPTPQQRAAALLDLMCSEVHRRSRKETHHGQDRLPARRPADQTRPPGQR